MKPVTASTAGCAITSSGNTSSKTDVSLLSMDQCSAGVSEQQTCCAVHGDLLLLALL